MLRSLFKVKKQHRPVEGRSPILSHRVSDVSPEKLALTWCFLFFGSPFLTYTPSRHLTRSEQRSPAAAGPPGGSCPVRWEPGRAGWLLPTPQGSSRAPSGSDAQWSLLTWAETPPPAALGPCLPPFPSQRTPPPGPGEGRSEHSLCFGSAWTEGGSRVGCESLSTVAQPCFCQVSETMAVSVGFILTLRRRHWRLSRRATRVVPF